MQKRKFDDIIKKLNERPRIEFTPEQRETIRLQVEKALSSWLNLEDIFPLECSAIIKPGYSIDVYAEAPVPCRPVSFEVLKEDDECFTLESVVVSRCAVITGPIKAVAYTGDPYNRPPFTAPIVPPAGRIYLRVMNHSTREARFRAIFHVLDLTPAQARTPFGMNIEREPAEVMAEILASEHASPALREFLQSLTPEQAAKAAALYEHPPKAKGV